MAICQWQFIARMQIDTIFRWGYLIENNGNLETSMVTINRWGYPDWQFALLFIEQQQRATYTTGPWGRLGGQKQLPVSPIQPIYFHCARNNIVMYKGAVIITNIGIVQVPKCQNRGSSNKTKTLGIFSRP